VSDLFNSGFSYIGDDGMRVHVSPKTEDALRKAISALQASQAREKRLAEALVEIKSHAEFKSEPEPKDCHAGQLLTITDVVDVAIADYQASLKG
jgi:hypothetical protein